ncbi:procollagen-lysine,2-oxoglutarate 5-dioxygenase-like [Gordionus sp. m RMFG-2023]|uniref:procollagen-lysine,2-oxoglutarate 5-dioxygenase-like n=1 Tax=Gordionus sp. m RMFG-2023 TaxID=3053472 RepID=UPI0031FCA928
MKIKYNLLSLLIILCHIQDLLAKTGDKVGNYKLLVFTVGTEKTDGFLRYQRSSNVFGLRSVVLGMDQVWQGGDVRYFPGGGQKINLLRKALSLDIDKHYFEKFGRTPPIDISNEVDHHIDDDNLTEDDSEFSIANGKIDYDNLIVLFTDSYDVILNGNATKIIKAFLSTNSGLLFSSEIFCWPVTSLAESYPESEWKNKYLNSGGFIGFYRNLSEILKIPSDKNSIDTKDMEVDIIRADEDDQLYYTKMFLDPEIRKKLAIKLDYQNVVFQNLNGVPQEELKLTTLKDKYTDTESISEDVFSFSGISDSSSSGILTVINVVHKSEPMVIHGNGNSKIQLNYLSNYVPLAWSVVDGCLSCKENTFSLRSKQLPEYPTLFLHLHVDKSTPFLREFLAKIRGLEYPKNKIVLDIYSKVELHDDEISKFLTENSNRYLSSAWNKFEYQSYGTDQNSEDPTSNSMVYKERDDILYRFYRDTHKPQYFFTIDSECHLDNPKTLILLIEQNKTILAPMLARPGKMWTNFWGALSPSEFYARSDNYIDIVTYKQLGIFNVPFISSCYLIQRHKIMAWIKNIKISALAQQNKNEKLIGDDNNAISFEDEEMGLYSMYRWQKHDTDMAFCHNLRTMGDFMYITNLQMYGHLIDFEFYETSHFNNDLYQIFDNPKDWEDVYIHPDWKKQIDPEVKLEEPCPDVYWFPIFTDRFCDELIEEMENLGDWSGGRHEDQRLAGGYENVPTDDIHMRQIGLERHWLHFLKMYITPIQIKAYPGYHHDPPEAVMNFVVRYKPTAQSYLRPHHDSSTFTINAALNRYKIDYDGGGVRFLRYNCSIIDTRKGWSFIHPGRLTHYHEGLLITNGTRYLMVSFVDP